MPIHLPPIRRRDFLLGGLAAGVGLLVPKRLWAEEQPVDPNSFLLLADNHVGQRRDETRHGMKPAETFAQACRDVLELSFRPGHAIVSGDCAMIEGRPGDYALYGELLKPLREAGMSTHIALGNHDHRQNFLAAFPDAKSVAPEKEVPGKYVSVVETEHANWFLLDSLDKTRSTPGLLGEAQIAWLGKALDARPDKPALVVAHHNLNPILNYKSLIDTRPLLKTLLAKKHVKAYFCGHTHWWSHGPFLGLQMVNIPTTAWPFDLKQPRGFATARTRSDGATITLHCLDPKHPKHGDTFELKWKA